jgi:GT2 family glycosyltransferase
MRAFCTKVSLAEGGVLMGYEFFEAVPITKDDIQESDFLQYRGTRTSLFAGNARTAPKLTTSFFVGSILKSIIQKYSFSMPHNSSKRKAAKRLVYALPKSIRNFIVSSLTTKGNAVESGESFSLDLGFGIRTSLKPRISIIIPVFNQWWVTYRCLRAIQKSHNICEFEVIVVDDASSDQTSAALKLIRGIKVVRNKKNLGYLEATNLGASFRASSSEFLALLNNDTEPLGNWLDELLRVFEDNSRAVIVGSTLFYPNGQLQESGAQIFKDGNGWNIGRLESMNELFLSTRQVDYCSAASLMVDCNFWEDAVGFDIQYKPAYYEDSDLAMYAWSRGHQVLVSPSSWVIHHEGISHGTSLSSGVKEYQSINRRSFVNKWKNELVTHWHNTDYPRVEFSRDSKGIIVICDYQLPDETRDSGSQRTIRIADLLMRLNYHVVIACVDNSSRIIQIEKLRIKGIEVFTNHRDFYESLRLRSKRIRFFWTIREDTYDYFASNLRTLNSTVPLIADLLDIRYEDKSQKKVSRKQIEIANLAEIALLVSPTEAKELSQEVSARVESLWYDFPVMNSEYHTSGRSGLIFVGGFRHKPNIEGILWFANEVLPFLRTAGFEEQIAIVGSGMDNETSTHLIGLGCRVFGYQQDLGSLYNSSRLAVVPLRTGAGLKGKLAEALSYGLPLITTSIGVEGFPEVSPSKSPFLVRDSAEEFASAITKVIKDENLALNLSVNAIDYIKTYLSESAMLEKISYLLKE